METNKIKCSMGKNPVIYFSLVSFVHGGFSVKQSGLEKIACKIQMQRVSEPVLIIQDIGAEPKWLENHKQGMKSKWLEGHASPERFSL